MLCKALLSICSTFILLAIIPPVSSGETIQGGAQTGSVPPAVAVGRTLSPEQELESAQARVKENPTSSQARVDLGYVLLKQGSLDNALAVFEDVLKSHPSMHQAKTGKGIVLARKGNLKEAVDCFKEALVLNPNPARTHYELGLVYEKLGNLEKAIGEFKEGIRKHEEGL
jgi:Flp pilus assembly protein TadD